MKMPYLYSIFFFYNCVKSPPYGHLRLTWQKYLEVKLGVGELHCIP